MNDLYDIWFTKGELSKLDQALHLLKDQDPTHFDCESLMEKLDHLIERANGNKA